MPAGEHTVNWDGRDRSGSDVSSGVYFIVMQAGGEQAVRKAMVVK
jgi:flagellar hook assembly protein FlgD